MAKWRVRLCTRRKPRETRTHAFVRAVLQSRADTAVIPMQDYLELGIGARMNKPGSLSCANWTWRAVGSQLTPALAEKIRSVTKRYGRLPKE